MTVSYSIPNTPAGTGYSAPYFNYVASGAAQNVQLTTSGNSLCVDSSTTWILSQTPESSGGYATPLLAGSSTTEQWITTTIAGTSAAGTFVFPYYHQYLQTMSYSVVNGGTPTNPIFSATNQFGSTAPQTVTTTAVTYWYDAGTSWSITATTAGIAGEQWITAGGTSGTITGARTFAWKLDHQYYLTMVASGPGTVKPASGWKNAGQSYAISATHNAGHVFTSWAGTGTGSFTGTSKSATVTMNSPITETATFT